VHITVPEAVPTGDLARLNCDYDLEKDQLYTIKWYRGDEEFYRFVPKESPPTRVFPLQGIHVDVSTSILHTRKHDVSELLPSSGEGVADTLLGLLKRANINHLSRLVTGVSSF
jgi:hypothetical protein